MLAKEPPKNESEADALQEMADTDDDEEN